MEKAIVTGSGGLLGGKLLESLEEYYNCVGVSKSGANGLQADVSTGRMKEIIVGEKPEIIFHTAAISDVDYCELNPKQAWDVNVTGTRNVLEGAGRAGAKVIHISTDFVFDGKKGMYKEDDRPNPVNYYGKTKLEAEKLVKESGLVYIIARPSVIYGGGQKKKFLGWVLESLEAGKTITVVDDHYNTPTLVDNLAEMLIALRDEHGIFHTSGAERISRYDFAVKIARTFELDETLLTPIKTEELRQAAKRPKDTSLDTGKIRAKGIRPLGVDEGLSRIKNKGFKSINE
ncbi:MAG: SDR family oxidoreductase [Candidatus Altiarchaeota archaeon]